MQSRCYSLSRYQLKIFIMKIMHYVFAIFYRLIWYIFFPFAYLYVLGRSLKEPGYAKNFSERLVLYNSKFRNAIWLHAVSLGEFRAARPIFFKLLQNKEKLLITTLTLPGRRAAQLEFKEQIDNGDVAVFYNPLEFDFLFSKFIKKHMPKFCVILECDLWPVMISSIKRAGLPLIFAQAQYPERGFNRDMNFPFVKGVLIKKFDMILAKSAKHGKRFEYFNGKKISVMGDARFEQHIPDYQIKKSNAFKKKYLRNCFTVCFASIGKKEDLIIVEVIKQVLSKLPKNNKLKFFFIFVPRHPSDFGVCDNLFRFSSAKIGKRSILFNSKLNPKPLLLSENQIKKLDGLWGDSLGEMNFYLGLSDLVFMGDSFNEEGSHNIIEPFALEKPVVVGPSIWGIEYPAKEALEAGILTQVFNKGAIVDQLVKSFNNFSKDKNQKALKKKITSFYQSHSGASEIFLESLINEKLVAKNNEKFVEKNKKK